MATTVYLLLVARQEDVEPFLFPTQTDASKAAIDHRKLGFHSDLYQMKLRGNLGMKELACRLYNRDDYGSETTFIKHFDPVKQVKPLTSGSILESLVKSISKGA